MLATDDDVDWYRYDGSDDFGSVVDPARQIVAAGVRLCKYIDCAGGEAEDFTCPSGTTSDTQNGHPGCCWTGGTYYLIDLVCGSSSLDSDNAAIYIRVDHPGGPGCEPYTVNYHY